MIGPRRSELKRVALVVSGASGVVVGLRLAQVLSDMGVEVYTVITRGALRVAESECVSSEWLVRKLSEFSKAVYMDSDWEAPLASSSFVVDACVAAPLSASSASKLSLGIHDNLALRTLGNCLRLGKPVVAVIRECPLGVAELRSLLRLAEMGVKIVPAVIGFYAMPQGLKDTVDFVVGKVLDVLGIENDLYPRWGSEKLEARRARTPDPCQALYGL